MRKPVIAAVIAGTIGFGGLVATAGFAQAAVPATVHHPAPSAKKPHKATRITKITRTGTKSTKVVAVKPKPKKRSGRILRGAHRG